MPVGVLSHGEGEDAFRALGSGPARALAQKEKLFEDIGLLRRWRIHLSQSSRSIKHRRSPVIEKIIHDCHVAADQLTIILTPTCSLAGVVQIVARVLEVALHKVHALGFPLEQIIDGAGTAPLPSPARDFITSMGRTNDAILFGGRVQLFVDCNDDDARQLAEKLPSSHRGTTENYSGKFLKTSIMTFIKSIRCCLRRQRLLCRR